ncbi:MAG: BatD family protein [Candidatus Omnitrophica bacterium]|jgi:hypothetical protein|nr:BatD family protein [Candidatus Omnitrophota bacterium]
MYKLTKIITLLLFTLVWGAAYDSPIIAKVNKNTVKTGEIFQCEIIIKGEFISPKLNLPKFENFKIVSQIQSKSYSFRGNETETEIKFTYLIYAKKPGLFKIEPAIIKDGNKEYRSDEIAIEVNGESLEDLEKILPYIDKAIDI